MEIKSKLKNKKKDVIISDSDLNISKEEIINKQVKINESSEIIINYNQENQIDIKNQEDQAKIPIDDKIQISNTNGSLINKIIYNVQLLLAMTNKVDEKLINLLSIYLSQDYLKLIIEERDCREICCNFLCGVKLTKDKVDKYNFDPIIKTFTKDDLMSLFCDIKCYQKFKDISQISLKFDYLRYHKIESVYLFSILSNYYPNNLYLDKISELATSIMEKNKVKENERLELILIKHREKYDKYFLDDIINKLDKIDINEGLVSVNKLFEH